MLALEYHVTPTLFPECVTFKPYCSRVRPFVCVRPVTDGGIDCLAHSKVLQRTRWRGFPGLARRTRLYPNANTPVIPIRTLLRSIFKGLVCVHTLCLQHEECRFIRCNWWEMSDSALSKWLEEWSTRIYRYFHLCLHLHINSCEMRRQRLGPILQHESIDFVWTNWTWSLKTAQRRWWLVFI